MQASATPAASNRDTISMSTTNAATGGGRRGVRGLDHTKMTEYEQIALCIQRSLAVSDTRAPIDAATRSVATRCKSESKGYFLLNKLTISKPRGQNFI